MNRVLIAGVGVLLFLRPADAPSCGPFFPESVFTPTDHPAAPDFAGRGLGIIFPSFWRRHLVVAFRVLNELPLTAIEKGDVGPVTTPVPPSPPDPQQVWEAAKGKIIASQGNQLTIYRDIKGGDFSFYDNCLGDALLTAAKTLEDRAARFGPASSGVKSWLAAQEIVFSNCEKGQAIPTAEPGLPPMLRADRDYQIAAAYFYSEDFDEARRRFQAIARDASSPWRETAPYLAARCLIRKASLGTDKSFFVQAKQELDAIGTPAARSLSQYVEARGNPLAAIERVAAELETPAAQDRFWRNSIDYTVLMDRFTAPPGTSRSPMTDWIVTYQDSSEEARAHALERWQTVKSEAWLIVAMSKAKASHPNWREFIATTDQAPRMSPAYATLLHHRFRLLLDAGEKDRVRTELDDLLARIPNNMPDSAINHFRSVRMELARGFDEFIRFAPRVDLGDNTTSDAFDGDSTRVFNYGLPLAMLRQVSATQSVPAGLRTKVRRVVETRAALLGGLTFDAAYRMLKLPGSPVMLVAGADPRIKEMELIDSYRNNWWCQASENEKPEPPAFLTAAQRAEFESEWKLLQARPIAAVALGRVAIDYARTHRADPRSPEALYLTVRATRYSCDGTSSISAEAFRLLHRLWPGSEWAKKTPYYY